MCRWLAYSGSPVRITDLLYKPERPLIDQSLDSTLGAETTNGDGFGIGWYGEEDTPGNDRNLLVSVPAGEASPSALGSR
jgi:predicted glutamine amidotransferase